MSRENYSRERRVVMFADIQRFARLFLSEDTQLIDFIQSYYELSGDRIVAEGGRIVKYIGDSVLSVFPAGTEAAAVRCAIDTESAFSVLVKKLNLDSEVALNSGINSGELYMGVFGHRSLQNEDIFGNAVNEAAMMMRGKGISVTEIVHNVISKIFETERLPDFQVKWQSEPIKAWRVLGE